MHKNLQNIVVVSVIAYIAFNMRDVFFGSAPANVMRNTSNVYIDATGEELTLSEYYGDYVWVDYAAEWCGYCEPQTRTLKSLETSYGEKVIFLTVVAGTGKVMERPTAETAMNWARRFNLDPNRVLAYFSTNTLPYHILYSPSGEILFQGSGLFNAGKITNILNTRTLLFN